MKHAAQVEKSDRRYHHVRMGINSRLDALQSAILLPKLEILDEKLAWRGQAAARYTAAFHAAGITDTPYVANGNVSAWAQCPSLVPNRTALRKHPKAQGIQTATHFPIPLDKQPAEHCDVANLPVGDRLTEQVMCLPMQPYVGQDVTQQIVQAVAQGIERNAQR
ncbi:MAG: DegT/DnrJ/EryC1/StrS family aminotransferase [Pseudomonadales bacterium]